MRGEGTPGGDEVGWIGDPAGDTNCKGETGSVFFGTSGAVVGIIVIAAAGLYFVECSSWG